MGANEDNDDEEEEVDDEGLFEAFDLAAIAAEAEQKARDMAVDLAARGVFTKEADPSESVVVYGAEGAGAFNANSFVEMIIGILGNADIMYSTVTDKAANVVAFEISAPTSIVEKLLRAPLAQTTGWRFWRRSDSAEALRSLPPKIAALEGSLSTPRSQDSVAKKNK